MEKDEFKGPENNLEKQKIIRFELYKGQTQDNT